MALHAVQNIGDALDVTREFLREISYRDWAKLAVVVFFLGGGMSLPTAQFDASGSGNGGPTPELPATIPDVVLPIVAAILVLIVLIALLFGIVGAIMEFVLIESLRSGRVSIRMYWRRRWRQGLRLFGFRLLLWLPAIGIFLGWTALLIAPMLLGLEPIIPLSVFLIGIPFLFIVALVFALISAFTTVFVVPIMVKEDAGVLAGWRRLWGSMTASWKQYLAYAVLGFVLTIATGILASIVVGMIAIAILIPFVVLGGITYLTLSFSSTAGLAVLVVLGAAFLAIVIAVWAIVQVPVVTYLRYYALLVLGDIDGSFDIIADRRRSIRE